MAIIPDTTITRIVSGIFCILISADMGVGVIGNAYTQS